MNQDILGGVSGVMEAALATGLFVSLCSFLAPPTTFSDGGQPTGPYVAVADPTLASIRCMHMPFSEISVLATETKSVEEVMAEAPRHVLLGDYYPQIQAGVEAGWQAVIDGTTYDLLGAESDSQRTQTRLKVRLASI